MKYGDDYHYAGTRLVGSTIRWGDRLLTVEAVDGSVIKGFDFVTHDYREVNFSECDFTPVKFGFINYGDSSFYTSRIPKRRDWRQGFRASTLRIVGESGRVLAPPAALGKKSFRESILNCVNGNYPSFKEVVVESRGSWCRDWSLTKAGVLLYRGESTVNIKDIKDINNPVELLHLKESFLRSIVK